MYDDTAIDLTSFFEELANAVKPFMGHATIKNANCNGCRVGQRIDSRKGPVFLFQFLAKGFNHVDVEVVYRELAANPEEYIDNLLNCLNDGLKQMKDISRTVVAMPSAKERAMFSRKNPIAEAIA